MISEEERKAIGQCKLLLAGNIYLHIIDEDDGGTAYTGTVNKEYNKDLETVLNLIEKLENMYNKEHNEHIEMKRQNGVLRNNERILKEKIEELEKREIWSTATINGLKDDFILKQKIRDKIEELEEEDLEIYDTDSEDLIIAKYEQRAVLDFAQQLLNNKEEKCQL